MYIDASGSRWYHNLCHLTWLIRHEWGGCLEGLFPPVVGIYPFGIHAHCVSPSFCSDVWFSFEVVGYNHTHLQGRYQILGHEVVRVSSEYDYVFPFSVGKRTVSTPKMSCEFFYRPRLGGCRDVSIGVLIIDKVRHCLVSVVCSSGLVRFSYDLLFTIYNGIAWFVG